MKTFKNDILKTLTVLILIISTLSVLLIPKPASATVPVAVTNPFLFTIRTGQLPSDPDFWLNQFVKPLVRIAVRFMLQELTQQIVRWTQGDKVGYKKNPQSFFRNVADKAGGEFLNQLSGINLCGNIGAFLNISLRTPPGLQQKLACSLTDIVANVNGFYKNFNRGGWPAFIKASVEPQNNPYGAYLIALDAKISAESSAVSSNQLKLGASYPFLGFEVERDGTCVPNEFGGAPVCNKETETLTPGKLITDQLSKATGSGIDYAVNSNDIDAAISTIVSALIQKFIDSSLVQPGDVDSRGSGPGTIPFSGLENTNFFIARVQTNISYADALLGVIDNELKNTYQELFTTLRNNLPPINDPTIISAIAALKEKITRLQLGKTEILSKRAELLNIKQIIVSTTNLNQLTNLGAQNSQLGSHLTRIATTAGVVASPPASVGNQQWDTVQEIQTAMNSISSSLTLINTMIEEANRQAALVTTPLARRIELGNLVVNLTNNQAQPLNNLLTSLTLLRDRLTGATNNTDIQRISTEALNALRGVNAPLQSANTAISAADIVLERIQ